MTPEEIQGNANQLGQLTRRDIQSVLSFYADADSAYTNLQAFLEGVTCMSADEKLMVLGDLDSYVI